jgi:zinc protease
LAYRAPAAANDDFFAFTVLDSLLTGPTGLNMFGGGGISNKTSRLYQALVEKEFTVSVHGGLQATIDPFLYDITLTIRPDKTHQAAVAALDAEIERIQQTPVTPEEIARAIKQARAMFAYGSENITNQAFWLGYAEMFSEYDWFVNYVDRLAQVTPLDIERIAREYLTPANRVVGIFTPTNNGGTHS